MSYQPPMISSPEGENLSQQEHQQSNYPQQQTNYNNTQFYQQQNYNNHQYQEQYDEAPYHEHIEPNDASAQQQQQQQQLLEPAKEANTSQADADASEPHYMKYRKPKGKKVAEKRVDTDKIAAQAEGTIVCCACCVAFGECFVGICACLAFCK